MISSNNQITQNSKQLIGIQKKRVKKLYDIYLTAMKLAFDDGNLFFKQSMINGNKDLDAALKIRSYHIDKVATKYQEFNVESLAKFFEVSTVEIRNAIHIK